MSWSPILVASGSPLAGGLPRELYGERLIDALQDGSDRCSHLWAVQHLRVDHFSCRVAQYCVFAGLSQHC